MAVDTHSPLDPVGLQFSAEFLAIELRDGRTLRIALANLPFLDHASLEERLDYYFLPEEIVWQTLDEGLDMEELVRSPHLIYTPQT